MGEWTETELAKEFVKRRRKVAKELDFKDDPEVEYEVPYSNYGPQGYADLVVTRTYEDGSGGSIDVVEFKSQSAIEKVTGANEILRQFNKMAENFFEDEKHADRIKPGYDVYFRLEFAPDPACIEHVYDNREVYETVTRRETWDNVHNTPVNRHIGFVLQPETPDGVAGHVNVGFADIGDETWLETAARDDRLADALERAGFEIPDEE